MEQKTGKVFVEVDDLDDLSDSVLDLIDAGKFDEAEAVCNDLNKRYPDQVDGIERLAMVYEARGGSEKAAQYYLRTAEFMQSNPGFDKKGIEWALDKVKQLKA